MGSYFKMMGGKLGGLNLMSSESLAKRDKWQDKASLQGRGGEKILDAVLNSLLDGTEFETTRSPSDLNSIYGNRKSGRPHGIRPDYKIKNKATGKSIYIEMKRQKPEGNAHERAGKYMMPGILHSIRNIANQPDNIIPVWWIFASQSKEFGIASDSDYVQEIKHWFKGIEAHVFLWDDITNPKSLIEHFEKHIKPLLE